MPVSNLNLLINLLLSILNFEFYILNDFRHPNNLKFKIYNLKQLFTRLIHLQ